MQQEGIMGLVTWDCGCMRHPKPEIGRRFCEKHRRQLRKFMICILGVVITSLFVGLAITTAWLLSQCDVSVIAVPPF